MIYYNSPEYKKAMRRERDMLLGVKSVKPKKDNSNDSSSNEDVIIPKNISINDKQEQPIEENIKPSVITAEESSKNVQKEILNDSELKEDDNDNPVYDDEKNSISNKLIEPLNWTDPIIYHDPIPEVKKSRIVKKYLPDFPESEDKNSAKPDSGKNVLTEDKTKTEGILRPLIKLNNLIIDCTKVIYLKINYKELMPTLTLEINDYSDTIKFKDIPGQNNIITVMLLPPKDKVYKKISLDFAITRFIDNGDTLIYYGKYKLLSLKQNKFEGIIYKGCSEKNCNKSFNVMPNTWETLHEIAKNTGLGFASTDKCKDINDKLPRLLQNINYIDYIENIMQYSGVDTDSIFDCWIDLYGYLVMVNISWVLHENIKPNNLSIVTTKGIPPTASNTPKQKNEEVIRTITNFKGAGEPTDLDIDTYEVLSSPGKLFSFGSLRTYSIFHPEGAGKEEGNNNLSTEQIQVVEESVDGKHTEEYEVSQASETYLEFNDYDVHQQSQRREAYLDKLRSYKLKVCMKRMNFGFQRGTLINVSIFEYNADKKQTILTSLENLFSENENTDPKISSKNPDELEIIHQASIGIINPSISGLYYIDGMEIIYDADFDNFIQVLYLIKKDQSIRNYANKHTYAKYEL